jgi:transglutaminase-like putative cysteine protease
MKFRVNHKTRYVYGTSVPLSHNVLRLRPRQTEWQRCEKFDLTIDPIPAQQRERVDFFGNYEMWISVQEPHRELNIESRSEIETTERKDLTGITGPPWEQVPAAIGARLDSDMLIAREYTLDSPMIQRAGELADYAKPSFKPQTSVIECVVDLTKRIFEDFKFDKETTTIGTPILEVLSQRSGVCQDFAQLEIGCLRSMGLAARYVSGYLVTKPPPGQERLVGADASHAWVSVFIPETGWLDLDPTNGVVPNGEHITLAWARDYGDIIPIKGVVTGGQSHSLFYSVDVAPVQDESTT